MRPRSWTPAAWSLLVYSVITIIIGREILASPATVVANDAGDPLLNAMILHWNAHHVPWTEAWWQLPIFSPTRDTLAFSEHLLGLSVITAPIDWITGNALVTYNIATLLTFPLSAMAMFLLVRYLTGSGVAAFIAGLAFGFAPYRTAHLPHIQMLAAFWAPLALLGLHAYLDTKRRRWLVLYGAAWMLQGAANWYALVFFSVLVGLWILWFVVARRRWFELAMIAAATGVAALPLVPIVYIYLNVHRVHAFARGMDEIRALSADVAAPLCAATGLTFWGWIRVACRPEGELFPGPVMVALFVAALVAMMRSGQDASAAPTSRWMRGARGLCMAVAGAYAFVIVSVLVAGPWRIDWAFIHVSVGSIRKPMLLGMAALLMTIVLSPGVLSAARRSSTSGFYLFGAFATWFLALGPMVTFMNVPTGYSGPFAWLLQVPGATSLRVPARFWSMTVVCLSVAAGIYVAERMSRRSRMASALLMVLLGGGVLADGWSGTINVQPVPPPVPDAAQLVGQLVLHVPMTQYGDIAAEWRASLGGWRSVNGYSGFSPSYYGALINATTFDEDVAFQWFQQSSDLHVIVSKGEPRLEALVERQPGAVRTAENEWAFQYRLPLRPKPAEPSLGPRLSIVAVHAACAGDSAVLAQDNDATTRLVCPADKGGTRDVQADLGRVQTVSAFVHVLGPYPWEAPRHLIVETSLDGTEWHEAWNGSVLGPTMAGAMQDSASLRVVLPFSPREARFLRARPEHLPAGYPWTVAEIEVLAPGR